MTCVLIIKAEIQFKTNRNSFQRYPIKLSKNYHFCKSKELNKKIMNYVILRRLFKYKKNILLKEELVRTVTCSIYVYFCSMLLIRIVR